MYRPASLRQRIVVLILISNRSLARSLAHPLARPLSLSLSLTFSVSRTADGITEDSCSERRRRRRRVRQRKALSSDANNTATSLGSAQLSSALPVRQELRGVPRGHEPSLHCDSILSSLFGFLFPILTLMQMTTSYFLPMPRMQPLPSSPVKRAITPTEHNSQL